MASLKIAILYENHKVYVRFEAEKFRTLFKEYFKQYKSIDLAFDKIIDDLKKETQWAK